MTIQPGDLDQRVTIQAQARTDDGAGGAAVAWADIARVWAKVQPLSGKERLEAQQLEAPVMYRVTIRNRADVTADMRILWRGKAMNIRVIPEAGPRPIYLTLDCETGVAT